MLVMEDSFSDAHLMLAVFNPNSLSYQQFEKMAVSTTTTTTLSVYQ